MRRRRIRDVDAQHEAVELRFGQRIGALELVRVLRREDDEPVGQRQPLALHRHLALFHGFEQRRLGLRASAVHLVHQQDVREHRPRVEHELLLARVEDVHADDVARHQVRRALDALEAAAEAARERFRDQRLAEARRALQQDVAARETGREEPCITPSAPWTTRPISRLRWSSRSCSGVLMRVVSGCVADDCAGRRG